MTHIDVDIFAQAQHRPPIDHQQSTKALWTDPHIAEHMLTFHLDPTNDAASYRHDIIDGSVDWMFSHFALNAEHHYLDLGCGPGQYTMRMADKGIHVTGVDFSENSIRYAVEQQHKHGLEIDYRCKSYLDIDFEDQFDVVTIISCDFCALVPQNRTVFLKNVRRAMKDDGRFLFDFHSRTRFKQLSEHSSWQYHNAGGFYSNGPHLLLTNQFLFEEEGISCTKYTIVKDSGGILELYLWHRYYHLNDILAILSDAGLQVSEVYGRVDGKPYTGKELDITIVATKSD